jgi:hypothetical protein
VDAVQRLNKGQPRDRGELIQVRKITTPTATRVRLKVDENQ